MSLPRRFALAVCMFFGTVSVSSQALELRGFRGVSWGDPATSLGEARAIYVRGEVRCYQRDRENLFFGTSALNSVHYCFEKDRFFMVMLDAAVSPKVFASEFEVMYGRADKRRGSAATWGNSRSGTRANLAANDHATNLAIYYNRANPAMAQRIQLLALAGPQWANANRAIKADVGVGAHK